MHIFALVGRVENRMVGVDIVTRPPPFLGGGGEGGSRGGGVGGSRGGQKPPFLGVFEGPKGPEQSPPEKALGGLFSGVSGGSGRPSGSASLEASERPLKRRGWGSRESLNPLIHLSSLVYLTIHRSFCCRVRQPPLGQPGCGTQDTLSGFGGGRETRGLSTTPKGCIYAYMP